MVEHILSLSYGKDSMACLFAIEQLGWPLDRIVTVDMWATDTIPADLPPMVEFKAYADEEIKRRWGIEVEHLSAGKTFEECFYYRRGRTGRKTKFDGQIYGWPMVKGNWCLQQLKLPALNKIGKDSIQYIGIDSDEPERLDRLDGKRKISPLSDIGWTETECWKICEGNGLLSPIYTLATRGGCWFCHGGKRSDPHRQDIPLGDAGCATEICPHGWGAIKDVLGGKQWTIKQRYSCADS